VDCNDYEYLRSGLIFVKHRLERLQIDYDKHKPNFEWVLLTHGHADHARGLKRMMATFGTRHFWYPKSLTSTTHGTLLHYANRSRLVGHHQAIDHSKRLEAPEVSFGHVEMEVLWPNHNQIDPTDENNNSVALSLILGDRSFVLTGDCEANNWPAITPRLPKHVAAFKVPHHGGRNGVFDNSDDTPWLTTWRPTRPGSCSAATFARTGTPTRMSWKRSTTATSRRTAPTCTTTLRALRHERGLPLR
jgi:hypothetical protein